jgi:hypothetical protein
MGLFEGKSRNERNKIIAAIVLGVLALASLFFAFGPQIGGSKATVTVTTPPTPIRTPAQNIRPEDLQMPTQADQDFDYTTTPVSYRPGSFHAPDPGRNIFAFYEPPPPCPECPTPTPKPPPPPTPAPTPPVFIAYYSPQTVYAGSKGFRLELHGDKYTPDTKVYFSQNQVPTTFISAQRISAEIPANMIAGEGPRQIMVQTADGKLYSNPVIMTVQAPPKPQFQYIGMIARKHANNDTAYFSEQGKQTPMVARLDDVVGGRFRLVSISATEVIFEDTNLGFRHRLELYRPAPGSQQTTLPTGPGRRGVPSYNPTSPEFNIPGIPDNIPRYIPPDGNTNTNTPRPARRRNTNSNDDDDDDDGDTDGRR